MEKSYRVDMFSFLTPGADRDGPQPARVAEGRRAADGGSEKGAKLSLVAP
jgi:hypothetical protein